MQFSQQFLEVSRLVGAWWGFFRCGLEAGVGSPRWRFVAHHAVDHVLHISVTRNQTVDMAARGFAELRAEVNVMAKIIDAGGKVPENQQRAIAGQRELARLVSQIGNLQEREARHGSFGSASGAQEAGGCAACPQALEKLRLSEKPTMATRASPRYIGDAKNVTGTA